MKHTIKNAFFYTGVIAALVAIAGDSFMPAWAFAALIVWMFAGLAALVYDWVTFDGT